jgi:hypothetical protein
MNLEPLTPIERRRLRAAPERFTPREVVAIIGAA